MNYSWHYNSLIETRKNREKIPDVYYEKHHIVMKSMCGTDDHDNIVYLTAREHFIAHWLLWRIHRNKQTAYAFSMMNRKNDNQQRTKISSVQYQEIREALSLIGKQKNNRKDKNGMFGKKHTDLSRQKMSASRKGRFTGKDNHNFGKTHSIETREEWSRKRKEIAKIVLTCDKCGKTGNGPQMYKNHFSRCKL